MADDPLAARAEWFAQFRDDVANFLTMDTIDAMVDRGVSVRPPKERVTYFGYADAASGTGRDSFSAAVGHREGDEVFVDALFEQRPPFNPQNTTADVCALFKQYRVTSCVGDKFAAGYNIDAFARCGVKYRYCEKDTSANYLEFLPLATSGRVRLLDNQRLISQLSGLERRTLSSGRDRVDHGAGDRHDDLSAACAGVCALAASQPGPMVISPELMNWARTPGRHSSRSPRMYLPDPGRGIF